LAVTLSHPINELEGIGPVLAERLAQHGVIRTEDLLALPASSVVAWLQDITGITANGLVNSFIPQARFLRLPDMTAQFAEGLAASGYRTYRDLVMPSAKRVAGQLASRHEEGLIPAVPDLDTIYRWQIDAGRRLCTGTIHLFIRDSASGAPISGVEARINGLGHSDDVTPIIRSATDDGFVFFEYLALTTHRVVFTAPDYVPTTLTCGFRYQPRLSFQVDLQPGGDDVDPANTLYVDEFSGGIVLSIGPQDGIVLERYGSVDDLPAVPPFVISDDGDGPTVNLVSLWRRRHGDQIVVPVVRVPRDKVPATVSNGTVVERQSDGTFIVLDGVTVASYRAEVLSERRSNPN
jgi:hypothetical protein